MNGTCFIVGSGDFTKRCLNPENGDLVIAADGGYRYLMENGIKANLLMGDFDSLEYVPDNIKILRFPSEKDDTDMGLSIQEGITRGYKKFMLYAGSGSRPDHFYANCQLMAKYALLGYEISLFAPDFTLYALSNSEILLSREAGTVFSVFSVTDEAVCKCIKNAKYEVSDYVMKNTVPLGVSNEFIGNDVFIKAGNGAMIVFVYNDNKSK